ncbi:putative MFS family arabinose efflux permease [Ancylobacter aquaticus]|uniref:Putative MFS family arabinose efflux permease n=1 Tax=Ancylobacter aquaticus TaxID=100 RepID=A0A4R1I824_ANCAQ|nr:MFS transporter [Ancylobacter aquaticus]TCK29965.1 putative MFS family arabinose efflux permease [Ancylobacter aquaticus]
MDLATLRTRAPLFLAVFIDIFSFGLMYPLIVALFESPSLTSAYSPATRDTLLSLAFSLFPIGMFFGSSMLGDLSDALGRRRTLMICMGGLAGSYALMAVALSVGHLWLFFIGRLLSGLMAGTAPIAQASVVDAVPQDQRSAAMAQVVLVNTIGMVAGPAIGGLLGHFELRLPLMVALVLCVVTLVSLNSAHFARDESRRVLALDWRQPFRLLARIGNRPAIVMPAASFFLFQLGFLIYYTFILIEMQRSYGFTTAGLGLFSMVMGIGCAFSSAIGFPLVRARLGNDKATALVGLALCGFFLIASSLPLPAGAQVALGFLSTSSNILAFITLLAAISSAVDESERGWALGIANAGVALSVLIAGLLSSLLVVLPADAFLAAGGVIVLIALLPGLRLPEAPAAAADPELR